MSWSDILLNIMLSILSAGVFWCISFKISRTKIIFSDKLIKSNTIKSGGYRIKIANIGKRDLIEMTIVAKLKVIIDDVAQVFFLDISGTGTQSFITLLAGMKSYKKEGRSNFRILTLFLSKPAKKRLKKLMNIKGKKKIQLRDIFKRYGENVEVIVYVYGNDRVIGTRRVFESPRYTIYDIVDDDSYKFKKVNVSAFDSLKTKQKKISSIHKNPLL